MARLLRVLVADDSVYDCLLLIKELRHAEFEPRYVRVDSLGSLRKALPTEPWELVLCDHGMPKLEMREAIRAIREHNATVPIVVLSDVAGDEPAVTAMASGAQYYMLRDKLDRLPGIIHQLLNEREKRESQEEKPANTDELLRLLLETDAEIIAVVSPDGVVKIASPSLERTLGYRPDELVGRNAVQWIHESDRASFRSLLENAVRMPTVQSALLRFRHGDGSWRTLDCHGRNLMNHPSVAGVVIDARDVTSKAEGRGPAETRGHTPPDTHASDSLEHVRSAAGKPMHRSLGRYELIDVLGEGGMGTVYKARDPKLERLVAIKIPRFDVQGADLATVVQRFSREARSAAQVRHPNVCPIYDVDEQSGMPFVVMAYVDGHSLADRLRVSSRFENAIEAVRLLKQVATGLKAVHAHGIIHRDLKPANILLDRDGQALLTDFGIARPEHETQRLTMHGAVIGTPGFMAPEQASSDAGRIGPWTDLYSLGVIMYCMLTGQMPFQGSALTVLLKQMDSSPPSPRLVRPDLDADLEAIVLKAMARHDHDRFRSADEMLSALDAWLAHPSAPPPTQEFREGSFMGDL